MGKKTLKINKANLQEALTIVKPGLASKEIIDQATSFAFIDGRVVTYNDSISISHPIEGVEITGAIQANELYSLLSKITKDEISMEEGKEGALVLKAGRSRAGFTLQKEIKLPLDEISLDGDWTKLPKDFVTGVKKVLSAASNDMSQPVLTCVHVAKKWIEASDSVRGSRYNLEKKLSTDSFLLPVSAAIPLSRINPTHVLVSSGWIHFKSESGTIFSTRSIEGNFPSISNIFELKKESTFTFPKGLDEVVHRAEPFYKRGHILQEVVNVTVEDGELSIEARADSSDSWFTEKVKCKGIQNMAFSIPPSLLLDILGANATVEVSDRFLSFKDSNWSYVCCTNKL